MSGPLQPPQYQSAYRACIKEAALQGAALMQATLGRALHELGRHAPAISDVVERNLLQEAVAVLQLQQDAIVASFPQALLAEFAHALAGDRVAAAGFDALSVIGDEQLQDQADLTRATQRLLAEVQPQLDELEPLLAAAQGSLAANARRHALRPETYLRALYRVARASPVSAPVRRRWLRYLPSMMGPELACGYRGLADLLRAQGVVAAPVAAPAPLQASADGGSQFTIHELRKLLSTAPPPEESQVQEGRVTDPAATDFSHTVPASYQVLQDMRKVDQLVLQLRQRQAAMPDSVAGNRAAFRSALQQQVRTPSQALALEVVHLMVEHLAGDERLLPPVQETIRELEPALLRLALADPRFFSDRRHPARQLLEQATQRSLAWSSVDEGGFREFLEGLQQAVEVLLETRSTGGEPFEIALEALQEAWEEGQPRGRRGREKAVRALLRAEQRNLLAERIAQQVRERPDAVEAPWEALAFLTGPWSQVLAQVRLGDEAGDDDPGGYEAAVTLVLWSVQPALAPRVLHQHEQLVASIDAGLASIDHPPVDGQRWQAVLRQLRTLAQFTAAGATPHVSEPAPLPPRSDAWLAPVEAHDSGFQPGLLASLPPVADEPDTLPPLQLQQGAWIELLADGWERWQLTWSSPHGLLFLFTQGGGASRSMTRVRLQHLLAEGKLRLVTAQAVVDGALDAVAQAAWRNSVHGDETP